MNLKIYPSMYSNIKIVSVSPKIYQKFELIDFRVWTQKLNFRNNITSNWENQFLLVKKMIWIIGIRIVLKSAVFDDFEIQEWTFEFKNYVYVKNDKIFDWRFY